MHSAMAQTVPVIRSPTVPEKMVLSVQGKERTMNVAFVNALGGSMGADVNAVTPTVVVM